MLFAFSAALTGTALRTADTASAAFFSDGVDNCGGKPYKNGSQYYNINSIHRQTTPYCHR